MIIPETWAGIEQHKLRRQWTMSIPHPHHRRPGIPSRSTRMKYLGLAYFTPEKFA